MSKVKQIKTMKNLCLIDSIQMQTNADVILKAQGRLGLPHKVIRINQDCICIDDNDTRTFLSAGDYIAAYRMAEKGLLSGNFLIVRLQQNDLQKIDAILMRRFQSSLEKEQASNVLPNVQDLPYFIVSKKVAASLSVKSKELYSSDGESSTKLLSIVQLNENMSFVVCDAVGLNKTHLYRASLGDVFCMLRGENGRDTRLVLTPKEDVPAIKMQEKKEKILRQPTRKKITTQKVLRALHRRKIEKTRN